MEEQKEDKTSTIEKEVWKKTKTNTDGPTQSKQNRLT